MEEKRGIGGITVRFTCESLLGSQLPAAENSRLPFLIGLRLTPTRRPPCLVATAIRAVAHLLPDVLPLAAPLEGTTATGADLGGAVGVVGHGVSMDHLPRLRWLQLNFRRPRRAGAPLALRHPCGGSARGMSRYQPPVT